MCGFDVGDSVNERCEDIWRQFEDESTDTVSGCQQLDPPQIRKMSYHLIA